jgi:hypothetical protein
MRNSKLIDIQRCNEPFRWESLKWWIIYNPLGEIEPFANALGKLRLELPLVDAILEPTYTKFIRDILNWKKKVTTIVAVMTSYGDKLPAKLGDTCTTRKKPIRRLVVVAHHSTDAPPQSSTGRQVSGDTPA